MIKFENSLYLADCIDLLRDWYSKGQTNFIDLIYIDPPFNSNRNYNVLFDSKLTEEAFKDTWSSVTYLDELEGIATMSPNLYNFLKMLETTGLPKSYISYLTKMSIRCWYMREMLKDTGSLYFHCDPTMSHYIKVMLDYVFGLRTYKNEIIWCYKSPGQAKHHFKRKHDTIFFYTKTLTSTFHGARVRISDSTIQVWGKHFDENGQIIYGYMKKHTPGWYKSLMIKGKHNDKDVYLDLNSGVQSSDWWEDIPFLNKQKERIGYPTQKPEKLLERIILASSNEGDLVADFFMGGGTTIAVAEKLNRRWIGSDINHRALQITQERIEQLHQDVKKDFFVYGIPRSSEELRKLVEDNVLGKSKNSRFDFEDVIVKYYLDNVIGNEKKVGDHSIDGYFMFKYNGQMKNGLVQVTTGAGIGHLKSFCSEIGKGTGDLGVYITFKDKVTNGMIREVKSYGKIGHIDKIQILTVEELIDEGKKFEIPVDSGLTI